MIQPTPTSNGRGRVVNLKSWLNTLDLDDFYAYDGSLTTPPCTEGIEWRVLMEVQSLSEAQYSYLSAMWENNEYFASNKGNHRRPQPVHDRAILASTQPQGWSSLPIFGSSATYLTGSLASISLLAILM